MSATVRLPIPAQRRRAESLEGRSETPTMSTPLVRTKVRVRIQNAETESYSSSLRQWLLLAEKVQGHGPDLTCVACAECQAPCAFPPLGVLLV